MHSLEEVPPKRDRKRRDTVYPFVLTAILLGNAVRLETGPVLPPVQFADKILHFLVFSLLATSIYRLPQISPTFAGRIGAFLICAAVGLADESLQALSPYRTTDLFDWAADLAGACTGIAAYHVWPAYTRLLEKPLYPTRPTASRSLANAAESR